MGPRWAWRRRMVLGRDQGCRWCGTPRWQDETWPVDHLIPRRLFPTTGDDAHDLANLALLCPPCHARKTHGIEPAFYKGDAQTFQRFLHMVGKTGPVPTSEDLARAYQTLTRMIREGIKT